MKHGTLSITRQINAPREIVYEAWTKLEHRKHWFVGPAWTEIERRVDLKVNGQELAHGRFEDGTETIYTAYFHLIDPNVRLEAVFRFTRWRRVLGQVHRNRADLYRARLLLARRIRNLGTMRQAVPRA
jgi:uncharacterized protein YndB with AHSA1/START domain